VGRNLRLSGGAVWLAYWKPNLKACEASACSLLGPACRKSSPVAISDMGHSMVMQAGNQNALVEEDIPDLLGDLEALLDDVEPWEVVHASLELEPELAAPEGGSLDKTAIVVELGVVEDKLQEEVLLEDSLAGVLVGGLQEVHAAADGFLHSLDEVEACEDGVVDADHVLVKVALRVQEEGDRRVEDGG